MEISLGAKGRVISAFEGGGLPYLSTCGGKNEYSKEEGGGTSILWGAGKGIVSLFNSIIGGRKGISST